MFLARAAFGKHGVQCMLMQTYVYSTAMQGRCYQIVHSTEPELHLVNSLDGQ